MPNICPGMKDIEAQVAEARRIFAIRRGMLEGLGYNSTYVPLEDRVAALEEEIAELKTKVNSLRWWRNFLKGGKKNDD